MNQKKAILSEYSTYPYTQSYYTVKGRRTHFICTIQDVKLHVVDTAASPVKIIPSFGGGGDSGNGGGSGFLTLGQGGKDLVEAASAIVPMQK